MGEKMSSLLREELGNISFPDSDVKKMFIDLNKHILKIYTDSCYLANGEGKILFNCKLKLANWSNLKISIYDALTNEMCFVAPIIDEQLADISEFNYGELIIFKGFWVNTGQWLEYEIIGGTFELEYELDFNKFKI